MHGVSSALALAHGCGSLALRHAAAATAACRPTRQPVAAPAAARLDPIRRVAAAGSVAARGSVAGVRRRSMSGSGPPNGGMTAGSKPQQQPGAVGPAAAAPDGASAQSSPPEDVLLQYVVLRRDLWTEQGWPLGSIVAQVETSHVAFRTLAWGFCPCSVRTDSIEISYHLPLHVFCRLLHVSCYARI